MPGQYSVERRYLPQVNLSSYTTILAATSRTVLTQKFINSADKSLDEVQYTFPLYDGVSVVGFKCTVASRTIVGVVKEKQQARAEYKAAVDRGETAGLLEQLPQAADVFTTRIGNVPAKEAITVEIVYLGELKHDAETDGVRFTIPTVIAPRYGLVAADRANLPTTSSFADDSGGIRIMVDVAVDEASAIRGLQSPSHPIAVSMGRTSSTPEDSDSFNNHLASATLTLGSTELEKDFIVVVLAKDQGTPRAMLEQHPAIQGQRALMATLVPKFSLPPIHPEIVFVVDRSGSMGGKIDTLVAALKIFLKSLPVGVKFNICSFGSNHTFLWPKSKTYDQSSLQTALDHLQTFSANYGGTEMLKPVEATVKNRYKDMPLEVMVITDGEIWNQQAMFEFINKTTAKDDARFFSLGIGAGASSSLVEGIARAGNGFAQFVAENEKMDKRVVRMLKGALTPHIRDYTLEVKYEKEDDDFEMVESVTDCLGDLATPSSSSKVSTLKKKAISLFDKSSTSEDIPGPPAGKYDHLPVITVPKLLQAPHKIPSLYPFNRTTVYLLISADSCQRTPKAVVLRATCEHGPLELEIPIQDVGVGETLHQLAAKKAVHELEEGRGWITEVKKNGKLIKDQYEGRWDEMVEREAVRLGVQFQVGGKWCSFVAVEANSETGKSGESAMGQDNTSEGTLFGGSLQGSMTGSLFINRSRSEFSTPLQTSSYAFPQPGHNVSPTPAVSGGLFRNNGVPGDGVLFGQLSVPPNRRGSDRTARSFAPSASSFDTVDQRHANAFGGTPVSSNNSAGLFSFGAPASTSLFGAKPASTLKGNANVHSVAEKARSVAVSSVMASSTRSGAQASQNQPRLLQSMQAASPPSGSSRTAFASAASVEQKKEASMGRLGDSDQRHSQFASYSAPLSAPRPKRSAKEKPSPEAETNDLIDYSDEDMTMDSGDVGSAPVAAGQAPKAQTTEDRMHALIALQEFDGSWAWVEQLFAVLGMDEMKLRAVCESAGLADGGEVRATMVAVAFLQAKAKAEEEVWEMVVEKAMGWLKGKIGEGQLSKVKEAMV